MNFPEKNHLKDNVYWTAEFHSFDQRHGDIYYIITLHEKNGEIFNAIKRYGARFSEYMKGNKTEAEFLREELTSLAKEGKTNIPPNIHWTGYGNNNHYDL